MAPNFTLIYNVSPRKSLSTQTVTKKAPCGARWSVYRGQSSIQNVDPSVRIDVLPDRASVIRIPIGLALHQNLPGPFIRHAPNFVHGLNLSRWFEWARCRARCQCSSAGPQERHSLASHWPQLIPIATVDCLAANAGQAQRRLAGSNHNTLAGASRSRELDPANPTVVGLATKRIGELSQPNPSL